MLVSFAKPHELKLLHHFPWLGEWVGVGSGLVKNKIQANSAKLELELGLSLAID
jgi:hypothetical protein